MATHELKIWPPYFEAVASGAKTFEIRKDDRGFKVGDVLVLRELDTPENAGAGFCDFDMGPRLTGREVRAVVTYVLPGGQFGLGPEYVAMGIRLVTP
jgi:hypothetical protein